MFDIQKSILLPLFLLFSIPHTFSQLTWEWQAPRNQPVTLNSMAFSDEETGWIVGDRGMVLLSPDGGRQWHQKDIGTEDLLTNIFFLDDQKGWITTASGSVLHTRDGGRIWFRLPSRLADELVDIHFLNSNEGWCIGVSGRIYRSTNGGRSWNIKKWESQAAFYDLFFLDENYGWIAGGNGVFYRTIDGGENWFREKLPDKKPDLYQVHFVDAYHGWMVGDGGAIFRSQNGGRVWEPQNSGVKAELYDVHFLDKDHGWAVGEGQTLLFTPDGGELWLQQPAAEPAPYMLSYVGIHAEDEQRAWIFGEKGTILLSEDQGANWKSHHEFAYDPLQDVFALNDQFIWATGKAAYMSGYGGRQWWKIDLPDDGPIRKVGFIDTWNGWILGKKGYILRTEDGGGTWEKRTIDAAESLLDMGWLNATTGWICGSNGLLLKTEDGGKTWNRSTHLGNHTWLHVHVHQGHTWLLSPDGALVRNGYSPHGWEFIGGPPNEYLSEVFFLTPEHGWLATTSGHLYETKDAGTSWKLRFSEADFPIISLHFLHEKAGAALLGPYTMLVTTNGGKKWRIQDLPEGVKARAIGGSRTSYWLVGEGGVILRGR